MQCPCSHLVPEGVLCCRIMLCTSPLLIEQCLSSSLQLKPRRSVGEEAAATLAAARHGGSHSSGGGSLTGLEGSMADLSLSGMSGSSSVGGGAAAAAEGGTAALDRATEWQCCAYLAPEGSFCLRANTLQGYADCNRCLLRLGWAGLGCDAVCTGLAAGLGCWGVWLGWAAVQFALGTLLNCSCWARCWHRGCGKPTPAERQYVAPSDLHFSAPLPAPIHAQCQDESRPNRCANNLSQQPFVAHTDDPLCASHLQGRDHAAERAQSAAGGAQPLV